MDNIKNSILEITKSKEYIEYNKYHEGNIFSITKTSRLEHMHSNFIAWILDSRSNHGLGDYPIKQFLAALQIRKSENYNLSSRWTNELDAYIPLVQFDDNWSLVSKVEREVTFFAKKKRSIDILALVSIENKELPIVIENKVDSSEHDDQTQDYFEWAESKFSDRGKYYQPIYIYLTPEYNSGRPVNTNFIILKYQDLLDFVLEPAMNKSTDERTKNNLSSYIRCLSYQADNKKGENIMATSKEEKELLQNFFQKNKNFMSAIIEMMMDTDDVDPKLKEGMAKIVSTRDYSKFEFNGNVYSKNQLVLAVVRKYVEDKKPSSFGSLVSAFPRNLQGSSGVIKKYSDLSANELKYKRFFIDSSEILTLPDGIQCVVCTQWGVDNIGGFIDKAKEYGYFINKILS